MLIRIEDYLHRRGAQARRPAEPRIHLCSVEPLCLPGMATARSSYAAAAAVTLPMAKAVAPQPDDLALLYAEATLL